MKSVKSLLSSKVNLSKQIEEKDKVIDEQNIKIKELSQKLFLAMDFVNTFVQIKKIEIQITRTNKQLREVALTNTCEFFKKAINPAGLFVDKVLCKTPGQRRMEAERRESLYPNGGFNDLLEKKRELKNKRQYLIESLDVSAIKTAPILGITHYNEI